MKVTLASQLHVPVAHIKLLIRILHREEKTIYSQLTQLMN